jgi:hypothetical protein
MWSAAQRAASKKGCAGYQNAETGADFKLN